VSQGNPAIRCNNGDLGGEKIKKGWGGGNPAPGLAAASQGQLQNIPEASEAKGGVLEDRGTHISLGGEGKSLRGNILGSLLGKGVKKEPAAYKPSGWSRGGL